MAQFVEFSIHAFTNHAALSHQLWWIVLYLLLNTVTQRFAQVQLLTDSVQRGVLGIETGRLNRLDGLQSGLELYHLARRDAPHSGL